MEITSGELRLQAFSASQCFASHSTYSQSLLSLVAPLLRSEQHIGDPQGTTLFKEIAAAICSQSCYSILFTVCLDSVACCFLRDVCNFLTMKHKPDFYNHSPVSKLTYYISKRPCVQHKAGWLTRRWTHIRRNCRAHQATIGPEGDPFEDLLFQKKSSET